MRATEPGTAQVRVRAASAQSHGGRLHLNGNQSPEGKNAVTPNRDDYLFEVRCVATETPTPTPGTSLPTATPTPQGTPISGLGPTGETFWIMVDPSSPVPSGFVRVEVLVYQGAHYPLSQFVYAGPDNCASDHYHAALALALEGSTHPDPNQNGCGFGAVHEVTIYFVDVPLGVADALPFRP